MLLGRYCLRGYNLIKRVEKTGYIFSTTQEFKSAHAQKERLVMEIEI